MAVTLNISLEPEQRAWVEGRKDAGGFSSASDVVRDLIRTAQASEADALRERFDALSKDGSVEAEPEESVSNIVRRVKQERRGRA